MLSESSCIPGLETMITVRPGSHVHRLITVLGLAGEYPVRSLGVLGNERTLRALVSKLSTTQELRNPDTGERMRVKLLQLTGIGNAKAIRFCSPYWNGYIRTHTAIIWPRFTIIDSPAVWRIGTVTFGLPRRLGCT